MKREREAGGSSVTKQQAIMRTPDCFLHSIGDLVVGNNVVDRLDIVVQNVRVR
jgi:hypothetical protein